MLTKGAGRVVHALSSYCGVFDKGGCAFTSPAKVDVDAQCQSVKLWIAEPSILRPRHVLSLQ